MTATERKQRPLYSGVLRYFPDALLEVAHCSWVGNEQHNPGEPLYWNRAKSTDEPDALARHLLEAGTLDDDGVRHSAKTAWRALALLQKEIEAERAAAQQPEKGPLTPETPPNEPKKGFTPVVGQRVRFLEDNYGDPSWGRKGEEGTVVRANSSINCDVKLDGGRGTWAATSRFLEPAPTPRYAVGDYAVYALDPDLTNWGVVEIREVVETGYRAKSMNPLYGIGTFYPEWLRPATKDEIAAATRITPCYAKLLKRKADGQVLRLWERCGDTTERTWWVDAVDSNQWAFQLAESAMTTRDYEVLDSYLLKGA